jgi:hypothetical protein
MGFISIRVVDFAAGSPDLTHPPPLPGLGTGYVETTRESLPVYLGGVTLIKDMYNDVVTCVYMRW